MGSILTVKKDTTKDPFDKLFYQSPEIKLRKGKQTNVKDSVGKKTRETTIQYISRLFT